jgi:hypothetical protein
MESSPQWLIEASEAIRGVKRQTGGVKVKRHRSRGLSDKKRGA